MRRPLDARSAYRASAYGGLYAWESTPKKAGRGYPRNLEVGPFQLMIDSWDLRLRAEKKSAETTRTYLEAAQWVAAGYLVPAGFGDWAEVKKVPCHVIVDALGSGRNRLACRGGSSTRGRNPQGPLFKTLVLWLAGSSRIMLGGRQWRG